MLKNKIHFRYIGAVVGICFIITITGCSVIRNLSDWGSMYDYFGKIMGSEN